MIRTFIVALLGLLSTSDSAKAQDYPVAHYFLICLKETDMFVMTHTWKYYGYEEFIKALDYYVLEKHYDGREACSELHGTLRPNADAETTSLILEEDFPFMDGDWLRLYLWYSYTPEGTFAVLSTALPIK